MALNSTNHFLETSSRYVLSLCMAVNATRHLARTGRPRIWRTTETSTACSSTPTHAFLSSSNSPHPSPRGVMCGRIRPLQRRSCSAKPSTSVPTVKSKVCLGPPPLVATACESNVPHPRQLGPWTTRLGSSRSWCRTQSRLGTWSSMAVIASMSSSPWPPRCVSELHLKYSRTRTHTHTRMCV